MHLHRLALTTVVGSHSAIHTLPVTIPPVKNWGINETSRVEINEGIKLFAKQCLHSPVVDLGTWTTEKEKASYWCKDFVHFSVKGYDEFGDMVYDTLKSWIEKPEDTPVINLLPANAAGLEFSISPHVVGN